MSPRLSRLSAFLLYIAAGSVMVWLWSTSASYPPSSAHFRRGLFLADLLLGSAILSQARFLQLKGSVRGGRLLLAIGVFIILAGVISAYTWISGN